MSALCAGFGVCWIFQVRPFQCSASVSWAEPWLYQPTAVHAFLAGHDTPVRNTLLAPAGFGVPWIAQPTPFQRSASETGMPARMTSPTTMQKLAALHDTAFRLLLLALSGAACPFHDVPSHVCANVRNPALSSSDPTARQELGVAQETALRPAPITPAN